MGNGRGVGESGAQIGSACAGSRRSALAGAGRCGRGRVRARARAVPGLVAVAVLLGSVAVASARHGEPVAEELVVGLSEPGALGSQHLNPGGHGG